MGYLKTRTIVSELNRFDVLSLTI